MLEFEQQALPGKSFIKIIGVGGGGNNAINYMSSQGIQGVDFIACNTDLQVLERLNITQKIQLGPESTKGLGAGANPQVGKQAAEESLEQIIKMLKSCETRIVLIATGLGGGTGTGASPVIAKICKELGILTIGVVTTPFAFEGDKRNQVAKAGLEELRKYADSTIVIDNGNLRKFFGALPISQTMAKADEVICIATKAITSIISTVGQINRDINDICAVIKDGGIGLIGQAIVPVEDIRSLVSQTLSCPLLLDNSIYGAKKAIAVFTYPTGSTSVTFEDYEAIVDELKTQTGEETDPFPGLYEDDTLKNEVRLTIIATGFQTNEQVAAQNEPVKQSLAIPPTQPRHAPNSTRPTQALPQQVPQPTGLSAVAQPAPVEFRSSAHFVPQQNPNLTQPLQQPPGVDQSVQPPRDEQSVRQHDRQQAQHTPPPQQNPLASSQHHESEITHGEKTTQEAKEQEERNKLLRSYVEKGRTSREKLATYSIQLPLDLHDPNSEAFQNPYIVRQRQTQQNWKSNQDISNTSAHKDENGNVEFSYTNKYIGGNIPD